MRKLMERLGLMRGVPRNVREEARDVPFTHYVHANTRQPDGWGANRYAFETLALAPFSPIDRGVRVRRQILYPVAGPQVWQGHAVRVSPTPSQAGGIFPATMIQPDGSLPPDGTGSTIDMLSVGRNDPSAEANDVSAVYGLNAPH